MDTTFDTELPTTQGCDTLVMGLTSAAGKVSLQARGVYRNQVGKGANPPHKDSVNHPPSPHLSLFFPFSPPLGGGALLDKGTKYRKSTAEYAPVSV